MLFYALYHKLYALYHKLSEVRVLKSCCFTGHLLNENGGEIRNLVQNELQRLVLLGVTDFFCGGRRGWDLLCADVISEIKSEHQGITLRFVLPCPPLEQAAEWSDNERDEFLKLIKFADSVDIISDTLCKGSVKLRNRVLVEKSDVCLCWFNIHRYTGNTLQTVNLAKKQGLKIVNLYKKF